MTTSPQPPRGSRRHGNPARMRLGRVLAASAVVSAALPLAVAGPARAQGAGAPSYAGFSSLAQSAPVHLEIYEPTVPIPASPQAELSFGYSHVEADTSTSLARASYLWPGDAVGEGFKTIVENLGLPPEVAGPLAGNGYPVQVAASTTGDQQQSDEPFPGMVMRGSASPARTTAQTGYSTDCRVDDSGGSDAGGGTPGAPPPGLPPLPGVPAPSGAVTPHQQARGVSAGEQKDGGAGGASCQIPDQLRALVDFGGYVSTSETTNDGSAVTAASRSAASDIDLLGGVITISGVHARSSSRSDGTTGSPTGVAGYGTLAIAGQEFIVGPHGVRAAGQQQPIPGLPDDPKKALAQLGVSIVAPKPAQARHGDQAGSDVAALVVTIDTHQLRSELDGVPFDEIVGAVPDQAGQLKSLLGAAVHLSPKFVITLGEAHASVDTAQAITFPTAPSTGGDAGAGADAGARTGGTSAGAPPASAGAPPGGSAPASAVGTLDDAAPAAAGLPPLYSLPGVLLLGGVGLAAVAGTWLRRIGVLALGIAGSCTHGLDSGLPDLRKG